MCQLRLDFITFNIAQPSTSSGTENDSGVFVDGKTYTDRSVCTTDQFIATSPGNPAPPVICGDNSGEHSKSDLVKPGMGTKFTSISKYSVEPQEPQELIQELIQLIFVLRSVRGFLPVLQWPHIRDRHPVVFDETVGDQSKFAIMPNIPKY